MKRVYNFNAGPAMLPIEVMEKAQQEFRNYENSGMSVMEISHRGKTFQKILDTAEANLRKLLDIPKDYLVAFLPGGATLQFSSVPLNFLQKGEMGAYSLTGVWAVKAEKEARNLGYQTAVVFDGKEKGYKNIPNLEEDLLPKDVKYLYITSNNTIYGTRYVHFPKLKKIPLVADMTSELLSRKINVEDFGYIFAGAQKNIGPAGLTIGIIRKDLLEIPKKHVPVLLDFKVYFENKSLYNTPPTYLIYIAGLVFEWCLKKGGLQELQKINEEKANLLYKFLDSSKLYDAPVPSEYRSIMNVVFHLREKSLEEKFIEESEKEGLVGLKGHRDVGGMRASIYNAMPKEGVIHLIEFMKDFEERYYK